MEIKYLLHIYNCNFKIPSRKPCKIKATMNYLNVCLTISYLNNQRLRALTDLLLYFSKRQRGAAEIYKTSYLQAYLSHKYGNTT